MHVINVNFTGDCRSLFRRHEHCDFFAELQYPYSPWHFTALVHKTSDGNLSVFGFLGHRTEKLIISVPGTFSLDDHGLELEFSLAHLGAHFSVPFYGCLLRVPEYLEFNVLELFNSPVMCLVMANITCRFTAIKQKKHWLLRVTVTATRELQFVCFLFQDNAPSLNTNMTHPITPGTNTFTFNETFTKSFVNDDLSVNAIARVGVSELPKWPDE